MYALLSRHFEGVTREQFEQDLAGKNWVMEIRRDERLIGFSTLLAREMVFEGRPIVAIYSGDTIVSPEGWGSPSLARTWITSVNHLRNEFSDRPCHWILLTSGFRTYRFLPVFWREFYPRFDSLTPPGSGRLLDFLAKAQYGDLFDPVTGIVRFPRPQSLRGSLRNIPAGREVDRHIGYFLEKNPGHRHGDELACLTEICESNLSAAGRRMVRSTGA